MRIDVLTLFPGMFKAVLGESIMRRAISARRATVHLHNIRDYSRNKHRKVDARPFGGGPGMVISIQPVFDALKAVKKKNPSAEVILMSPQGKPFTQKRAAGLSRKNGIILISGHYEGVDERIRELVDSEISIGDYVMTGGEIPAMVVIDAVVRLIPGVLGHAESVNDESFSRGLLEYPQYTRPADYKGRKAPEVLASGNHRSIDAWRRKAAIYRTMQKRPDLIYSIKQLEMGE